MASKQNYIASRIAEQHNVEEYKIKDLPLDLVMTAFMAESIADANRASHVDIIGEELRSVVADLRDGKAVMINSRPDCELYYVVAHENDLVAAFYPIGPWQEIYAAISSDGQLLEDFGIVTPSFMDKTLIDKLFRFPVKVKKAKINAAVEPQSPVDYPAWAWHKPVVVKKDDNDKEVPAVVVTPTVTVTPVRDMPQPVDALERQLDSQMGRAFERAQGGQEGGSRSQRNHTPSRRERDHTAS